MLKNNVPESINDRLTRLMKQNHILNNENIDESLNQKRKSYRNIIKELNKIVRECETNVLEITKTIEDSCEHNYVRDRESFDPCRTLYYCSKCDKCN